MKRALVFSGGGSRGAYEIGAWKALNELGIRFQSVYGTSIGAINAGLAAQGDVEIACALWDRIDLKQVVATDEEDFAIDHLVSRKRDVIPFLLENAKHLHMDITPLENLMKTHLDESRVRASGMELGVMTVRIPQMTPAPARLKDIPEGRMIDWLIASASCFPVFPSKKIEGERYIDGGYFDNLPIDMAIRDGADEIVAVDIHPQPTHPEYARMPFLKMIHPLHNLGGFLDFNPKLLKRSRRMGYYDAMKAYDFYDGVRYTFIHRGELRTSAAARRYTGRIAAFDAEAITRTAFRSSQEMDAPLMSAIGAETPLRPLSWKEVYLRGLELCAQAMAFREDAIYDPDVLTARMLNFARTGEGVEAMDGRDVLKYAEMGSRELISYLYRALRTLGDFPAECVGCLSEFPAETAAALYLSCAEKEVN